MLNNDQINELITEEKVIIEPPRKDFKEENKYLRNDFRLTSVDGVRKYSVFMRKHTEFMENFSIGLVYYSEDGTNLNLFRCNGNHGQVFNNISNSIPHFGYHIHKITSELLQDNIFEPKYSELTKEFASYEQAFIYFCRYTNIRDIFNYFPNLIQPSMF